MKLTALLMLATLCIAHSPAWAQVLEIEADGSAHKIGPGWNQTVQSEYADTIRTAAGKYGLSPALLDAVARTESGYNPAAVSPAGAVGIMQLTPATARSLGVDAYDPVQNIFGGAAFLRQQLDRFDDNLMLALRAYNASNGSHSAAQSTGAPQ